MYHKYTHSHKNNDQKLRAITADVIVKASKYEKKFSAVN